MKKLFLAFLFCAFIISCKKNTDNNPSIDTPTSMDYLSDEQLQILDNAGIDTTTKFADLLFPDGTKIIDWEKTNDSGYHYLFNARTSPASDKKQLFIDVMMHAADLLTNKSLYKTITNQKNGLAYVYGSRHLNAPTVWNPQDPKDGKPAICQTPLYGLDCNGMIYQMATAGGIKLSEGNTTAYATIKTWNDAFNDPSSSDFNGLQMMDLKNLDWNLVQAGDIVVSIGSNNHIGMIYDNGKFKGMIHSHGSPSYTCDENTALHRGPDKTPKLLDWVKDMFGTNYHILRVVQNGKPGLTTTNVTILSETSVSTGGIITNDGGSPITARGICWNTDGSPTGSPTITTDNLMPDPAPTNGKTFTSILTGLDKTKTYHVRAYATNANGTDYGKDVSFTTLNNDSCDFTFNIGPPPSLHVTYGHVDFQGNIYQYLTDNQTIVVCTYSPLYGGPVEETYPIALHFKMRRGAGPGTITWTWITSTSPDYCLAPLNATGDSTTIITQTFYCQ
jgi:hypothetical protein